MSATAPLKGSRLAVRLGDRMALDGVDVHLRPGQVTAVVGPNGAGKSTLLACLAGLRRPDTGEVRLGEIPLAKLSPRQRARQLGYLPQTPEVAWRLDVETLVSLGRTPHAGAFGQAAFGSGAFDSRVQDRAAVQRALRAADVSDLARRDVTSLSGGERGRVLIARALAGEPDWLLADEPLTGLDIGCQLDISSLLRRFAAEGGGVVVSVHDLAFAARTADRVIVMAEGCIEADDHPARAMTPVVLARAYGVEARWLDGTRAPALDLVGRLS